MSKTTTVARPYAKAAFEFSLEEKKAQALDSWSNFLEIASALVTHQKVEQALSSPRNTAEDKATIINDLIGDVSDSQRNFIAVLAYNKRLEALPDVSVLFNLFKAAHEKTVDVDVQTAFALSDAQLAELAVTLESTLKRKVAMTSSVDKALIGGVLVHAGDTVIDASVKGKIGQLNDELTA